MPSLAPSATVCLVRELRAYGEAGSFVSYSSDVQAQSIFAGKRPVADLAGRGYEPGSKLGRPDTLLPDPSAFRLSKDAITTTMRPSPVPRSTGLRLQSLTQWDNEGGAPAKGVRTDVQRRI